jgi:hypothetical protein
LWKPQMWEGVLEHWSVNQWQLRCRRNACKKAHRLEILCMQYLQSNRKSS